MFKKVSKHYIRFGLIATVQVRHQEEPGSRTGGSPGLKVSHVKSLPVIASVA